MIERSRIRSGAGGGYTSVRLDFSPVLLAAVFVFVVFGTVQFFTSLPGGEQGLLRFETAYPIHDTAASHKSS